MNAARSLNRKVLISGGGIAGLALGILLREQEWEATIIERDAEMRTEGYVMDFAGTGWDVAERMQIIDDVRAISYQVNAFQYVDANGKPYATLPLDSVRDALDGKYTYLRRSDLEHILFSKAQRAGLGIQFGTTIQSLKDQGTEVDVILSDGTSQSFALVFGADGVHSRVRELAFGPETEFSRFLGYYVAAFHIKNHPYNVGTAVTIYEEPNRALWVYSLRENELSAMYVFKHEDTGYVPPHERLPLVQKAHRGAGWIAERLLADFPHTEPIFFDSTTQIVMPSWSKGRVALLGDACACLTLLAGQGSHLALAEAFVLATELGRHNSHAAAFAAYEQTLKAATAKKQKEALRLSKFFVPSDHSFTPLRRFVERMVFNKLLIGYSVKLFGVKSVLSNYR